MKYFTVLALVNEVHGAKKRKKMVQHSGDETDHRGSGFHKNLSKHFNK